MTPKKSSFGALVLLWLAGNCLRVTILAVPPVLALIIRDFALSGTQVGVLNAIPVCLFALVAVPGSLLIARLGAVPALVTGLLIAAAGSAARSLAFNTATLFAATAVMAAGIAVMQPALPPTVRRWVPHRIGFATAIYTNGLLCGEILAVTATAIALPALAGNWRADLALWSVPPAVVALIIFFFQPRESAASPMRHRSWMPDWRDPLLWKIGLMLGAINQLYFCSNAFLPGFLVQTHRAQMIGPALTALNIGQLPASFLLLAMAKRWERRTWPLLGAGILGLCGVAGVLMSSGGWDVIAASSVIGFACAVVITLVLTLPALLAAPDDVPRLSAGVFTIGYGGAMIVSILGGLAWDATGTAAFAFLPVAIATLPVIVFALLTDLSRRCPETAC